MKNNDTKKATATQPAGSGKKAAAKKVTTRKAPTKKPVAKKVAASTTAKKKARSPSANQNISAEERRMMIALHAYYKWEQSGRPDNAETRHWLEAEQEIENMLGNSSL